MNGSTVNNLIEPKIWPLCKQGMVGSMDGLDPPLAPNKPGLTHTESYSPLHTKPPVLFLHIIPTSLSSHVTLMVPAALNRPQSVRLWLWFCLLKIRDRHPIMQ